MTTPKTLRKSPQRRFEEYVLTRITSPYVSLVDIHDNLFIPCSPQSIDNDPGLGYTDDGISVELPIGFDFEIDNITYKSFVVSTNGWMALVDPIIGTFDTTQIFSTSFYNYDNGSILSTFLSNAILIAPWFDDLRNIASDTSQMLSTYGSTKIGRINLGLEPPAISINSVQNSVKYFYDKRSNQGRRLIVRWNSLSFFTSDPTTILRFEVVLYENGKIEFRYASTANINISTSIVNEGASIGIFMPNGTDRWRDFSYGLGYRDDARQQYRFGGAVVDNSYTDNDTYSTCKYTLNLKPYIHWPGLNSVGSMFVFSPPTNRRKILPRVQTSIIDSRNTLPTIIRTGDRRLGNDIVSFDDRRTLLYYASSMNSETSSCATSSVLINAPTTLQRFYGDSEYSVTERQNLFAGGIEFTASVAKSSAEQYIAYDNNGIIAPFSEHNLYESDNLESVFFATGSSLLDVGEGLTQPLKSKTQIKFSLPIEFNCQLNQTSSCIYYYNKRRRVLQVPENSTYTLPNLATTNTSGISKGDIAQNLSINSINKRILIDEQRGFGPIGNLLASGSHTPTVNCENSDSMIGALYSHENVTTALNRSYDKSINIHSDYAASKDETFTIPITQPFLLEKAVIEFPFIAGNGWFADKTQCFLPIENEVGSFDFAGPALTIGLFNQIKVGSSFRRDLILTGTITHQNDNSSELVFSTFHPHTSTYQIRQVGFESYGGVPSAVVKPTNVGLLQQYTGSIIVQCESQVTNGVLVRVEMSMTGAYAADNRNGVIDIFNTPELVLQGVKSSSYYDQSMYITSINNFGRGGTGFESSGRSIFGNEFVTPTNISSQGKVQNPFYYSSSTGLTINNLSSLPTQFSGAIVAGNNFRFNTLLPIQASKTSPYLVLPGDSLVLSLSKTRPFFFGSQTPFPHTSGSIIHDVLIPTGAINITLYGSLIREGKEFHDTLNQTLSSDAIHEIVIGNEQILDQFEGAYKDAFESGSYDDYVCGTMITKVNKSDGNTIFVTGSVIGSTKVANILSYGSRGRIFGKNKSQFAPTQGTSLYDYSESLSIRLQSYKEKIGLININQCIDDSERYYDSMLPSIAACFKANGAGIFIIEPSTGTLGQPLYMGDGKKIDNRMGFIWFDFKSKNTDNRLKDCNWSKSYPFEPRYNSISRQRQIEKSFLATYSANLSIMTFSELSTTEIEPVTLTGFSFGSVGSAYYTVPAVQPVEDAMSEHGYRYHWISDLYLDTITPFGYVLTGSASTSDITKALFGFGDVNNIIYNSIQESFIGTNHAVDFRYNNFVFPCNWHVSPLIRGWKYGVYNALPTFSKAYFRTTRYGQFRDMLEQRQYSKFYISSEKGAKVRQGVQHAVVSVKFVDAKGKITNPENTTSQNLSFEATSSVPYFDGEIRNRNTINQNTLNSNIITFNSDQFGNTIL